MTTRTKPTKPVQMCIVTMGYTRLLMPADKGMKLVEVLQSALTAEETWFDDASLFNIGDPPNVEFKMIRPSALAREVEPEPLRHRALRGPST